MTAFIVGGALVLTWVAWGRLPRRAPPRKDLPGPRDRWELALLDPEAKA